MDNWVGLVGLFVAGMVAGVMNSVAGGGSLVSFPMLVAFGEPAILANATNTAAMWPGSLSSALAYSRDTQPNRALVLTLVLPSAIGGLLGAFALVVTPPDLFDRVVPFLVLFATLLFASRGLIDRLIKRDPNPESEERVTFLGRIWGFLFQLFVATYGGYFGAGIGILMLGSLSIMGFTDIHRMNALKTILATLINLLAFFFFAAKGLVVWHLAILMAIGAIIGGYGGARLARRIDQRVLHAFVIGVGLFVSVWLFTRI
ncbi:MAG: sulfite exporter TauE/SafE family protein [Chloroflexota bacterium]|nr:sulfite exporter TauE/SafE family protein [Chloroflexota bacterium]